MHSGLLLLDKPSGPTSHDMVYAVRRATGEKRVGHAGTLDPLASGLLILCLGSATRLSEYLIGKPKRYQARVRLGQSTNTFDSEGEITAETTALPDRAAVEQALGHFLGIIEQRPPAFSAVKRAGRKAYELARRGEMVELASRSVEISRLELRDWNPPECELAVVCSAGTYIRALAHDLGRVLGCGAHLTALRRTASGDFSVDQAVPLAQWQAEVAAGVWERRLLPPDRAVGDWPAVQLTAEAAARVRMGQPVPLSGVPAAGEWARAYNPAGQLVALLHADLAAQVWRPHKVLGD